MINLKDILKDSGIELGKVYTDKDSKPFQVNEYGTTTSDLVGLHSEISRVQIEHSHKNEVENGKT